MRGTSGSSCGKPVDVRCISCGRIDRRNFFSPPRAEFVAAATVHALSRLASLVRRARAHRILALPNNATLVADNCDRCRSSLRRIHRRTPLSDRSRERFAGPLARLHRAHPRRADRAHAVLWDDAGRGRASAVRVADARARARRQARLARCRIGGMYASAVAHLPRSWPSSLSRRRRFAVRPPAVRRDSAARLRSHAAAAGRDRQDLARGERRLHADGEDHLPQPGRRHGHSRRSSSSR